MKKFLLTSMIPVLFVFGNQAQIPSDSLIAKYPFNNNAKDESGNGNNGIVYGAFFTQDRFDFANRAIYFDGIDDFVDIGKMNTLYSNLENFSISFWIKSDSVDKYCYETVMKTINDAPKGTLISIEVHRGKSASFNPGVVRLDIRDEFDEYFTMYIDKPEIFDNNWHNVIFVVDSTSKNKGEVFVDKLPVERDSVFTSLCLSPSVFEPFEHPLTIGAANNREHMETYFRGALDDIRFYNRSLDIAEIEQLFYEGYYREIIYDTVTVPVCDSIIFDTVSFHDTTHIYLCHNIIYDTVYYYDTISVLDTLIINLKAEGDYPPEYSVIIKVFPNPASEKIYIHISDYLLTAEYEVKIINNQGVLVFETFLEDQLNEIDLNQIGGPGFYYLQILNNKSEIIEVRKLLLTQ